MPGWKFDTEEKRKRLIAIVRNEGPICQGRLAKLLRYSRPAIPKMIQAINQDPKTYDLKENECLVTRKEGRYKMVMMGIMESRKGIQVQQRASSHSHMKLFIEALNHLVCDLFGGKKRNSKQWFGLSIPVFYQLTGQDWKNLVIFRRAIRNHSFAMVEFTDLNRKMLVFPLKVVLSCAGLAVLGYRFEKVPDLAYANRARSLRLRLMPLCRITGAKIMSGCEDTCRRLWDMASRVRTNWRLASILHSPGSGRMITVRIEIAPSARRIFRRAKIGQAQAVKVDESTGKTVVEFRIRDLGTLFLGLSDLLSGEKDLVRSITVVNQKGGRHVQKH